ncbi:hypothetical protein HMPREF1624_04459 [Sporothrix schenckii ATCC 58251]|uniref:Chromatin modification-related protein EAF3 n=2 Tax=Sporothrix schenckii TaxID=29908 RepID=U7PWD8_SPOS1|nr:hypothetical protein HMPREF1624_04459 [Sporothrix schenckii ATCC 58251]
MEKALEDSHSDAEDPTTGTPLGSAEAGITYTVPVTDETQATDEAQVTNETEVSAGNQSSVAGVAKEYVSSPKHIRIVVVNQTKRPQRIEKPRRSDKPIHIAKRKSSSGHAHVRIINRRHLKEDNFHNRPSIRLTLPDHLKAALVDDWENVTKNQQLVPLPHKVPAETVLDDYLTFERPHREEGSASLDILEETVAGLREYFNKCLGRILLYRFERPQYIEMHELWETDEKYKSPIETYGAEHLCRLLVSLPELISQTNMDQQSVNRLRDELAKLTTWLGKNMVKYFVSEYETPNSEYGEKVRGA